MRTVLKLTLALAALAAAGMGLFQPERAEATCPRYCCPSQPTRCAPCCFKPCDIGCP
jgi:hypothetical protein